MAGDRVRVEDLAMEWVNQEGKRWKKNRRLKWGRGKGKGKREMGRGEPKGWKSTSIDASR